MLSHPYDATKAIAKTPDTNGQKNTGVTTSEKAKDNNTDRNGSASGDASSTRRNNAPDISNRVGPRNRMEAAGLRQNR